MGREREAVARGRCVGGVEQSFSHGLRRGVRGKGVKRGSYCKLKMVGESEPLAKARIFPLLMLY